MNDFFNAVKEFVSELSSSDWVRLLTAFVPAIVRLVTNQLLKWSAAYEKARLESSQKRNRKKLITLGPSPDYVQGLLDDLLSRQKLWVKEGKSPIEVLIRTLGWGLQFFGALTRMTWDNVWSAARKEEKQNKEG